MPKHVVLILANGNEEIEALTQVDLLRRAGVKVTIAGLGGTKIKGSHNIIVQADTSIDQFSENINGLILPGGMPGTINLGESEAVLSLIRETYKKDLLCAAICAAPVVFEIAGILKDKKFTCFPSVEKKIKTGIFTEENVVQDSNIITSRGVGTAIQFALTIIEYLTNKKEAQRIASTILFPTKSS